MAVPGRGCSLHNLSASGGISSQTIFSKRDFGLKSSLMLSELSVLMNIVAERFRDAEHDQSFAIRHSVLHMAKTMGMLAAECEGFDHGKSMNVVALREATIKMLM